MARRFVLGTLGPQVKREGKKKAGIKNAEDKCLKDKQDAVRIDHGDDKESTKDRMGKRGSHRSVWGSTLPVRHGAGNRAARDAAGGLFVPDAEPGIDEQIDEIFGGGTMGSNLDDILEPEGGEPGWGNPP